MACPYCKREYSEARDLKARIAALEAERERDAALIERLKKALEQIASEHQSYDNVSRADGDRMYAIGVTDGHRCAATIARAAFAEAEGRKP